MRIVVVDNDWWVRYELGEVLGQINYTYEVVGMAENGQEGLELIRSQKPDLVITAIQMPVMDGLTMLSFVRAEGLKCKILILSDYIDFEYARRAIALGVQDYLYKPDIGDNVREEFTPILGNIEKTIQKEKSCDSFFRMEHIFLSAITGQLEADGNTDEFIEEEYGIRRNETIAIYGVSLKENYTVYHKMIRHMLDDIGAHEKQFCSYIMEFPYRGCLLMLLYHLEDTAKIHEYFKNTITPMLSNEVNGKIICSWECCDGMRNMYSGIVKMHHNLEWNLYFGKGQMISTSRIEELNINQPKYPYNLENYIKAAVFDGQREEYLNVLGKFQEYCVENVYSPKDTKEMIIRCFLMVLHLSVEVGKVEEVPEVKDYLHRIGIAVYWHELREVFLEFFDYVQNSIPEQEGSSVLVQKAMTLIAEYYNQGITLGEIAKRLCVSEAYLSTQLKCETGRTFTEIIRNNRISHVKRLLIETSLKLNEIADKVGYSDAKYMSKVFKEEVGMLPAEYRKKNNGVM